MKKEILFEYINNYSYLQYTIRYDTILFPIYVELIIKKNLSRIYKSKLELINETKAKESLNRKICFSHSFILEMFPKCEDGSTCPEKLGNSTYMCR